MATVHRLPDNFPDSYLGDGVYASYDGYHVILHLRPQDERTRIYLDPEVLDALDRYREAIRTIQKFCNQGNQT